mgnify:CR=1 FL=1
MILTRDDIAQFEQRYRTAFVNSLAGFRQAVLVGTKSRDNNSNLAIFNSLIHLGANPALLGLINRPDSVQRDTLQNIIETKEYTLNYVSSKEYEKAHQTSASYEEEINEFDVTGIEAEIKPNIISPFVKNSPVQLLCKYLNEYTITENNTIHVIATIESLFVNESLIKDDYWIQLDHGKIVAINGLDGYAKTSLMNRFSYARPGQSLKIIK